MGTQIDNEHPTSQCGEEVSDEGHGMSKDVSREDEHKHGFCAVRKSAKQECPDGQVASTIHIHRDIACRRALQFRLAADGADENPSSYVRRTIEP